MLASIIKVCHSVEYFCYSHPGWAHGKLSTACQLWWLFISFIFLVFRFLCGQGVLTLNACMWETISWTTLWPLTPSSSCSRGSSRYRAWWYCPQSSRYRLGCGLLQPSPGDSQSSSSRPQSRCRQFHMLGLAPWRSHPLGRRKRPQTKGPGWQRPQEMPSNAFCLVLPHQLSGMWIKVLGRHAAAAKKKKCSYPI